MKWLLELGCILLVLSLSGCYQKDTFDSEVIIRPGAKGFTYEVQIKGHGEGRGNIHNPFDWKVHHWDHFYWLYVNNIEGTIAAKDLVLTTDWRCVESSWSYSNVKGHIEFQPGKVIVALDLPRYSSGSAKYNQETKEWETQEASALIGHGPLDANGTYSIARVSDQPWKPTVEEARALEVAPCKH
jgi:hypothetical protein